MSVGILFLIVTTSCEKQETEVPTKTKMEGVWLVTEAYDSTGTSIIDKIQNSAIPLTAFWLASDNSIASTSGPMTTYIVYGDSKWTEVSSKIDQVFNYANLSYNGGEFFVADGTPDRFTIELKLEGIGGTSSLVEILDIFNIQAEWLKKVVYHKFMDVAVSFNETGDQMIWEWDNQTSAVYNMKDQYGNYVLWNGWPVNNFSKCRFILTKQSKTLNDLTIDAYDSSNDNSNNLKLSSN
ncbi:MAG TPA: hypothetical protein EYP69_05755 [Bacteroidales bacterium]|nr:hypothetical protein [Bacteroidales bacterium]